MHRGRRPIQRGPEHKINELIRASEVRIVGDQIESRVVSSREALAIAQELELDLVEGLGVLGDVREDIAQGSFPQLDMEDAWIALNPPETVAPYLERMGLENPGSMQETLMQRLLILGLAGAGHL